MSLNSARSQGFMDAVDILIKNSKISTEDLETQALILIKALKVSGDYNRIKGKDIPKLELHKILDAMLHNSDSCGGAAGRRYTVCAICICLRGETDSQDTLESLQDLATTWVSHFLWVCVSSHSTFV